MILIVTNKTDYTADYLILGLKDRHVQFARFNTEDFPSIVTLTVNLHTTGNLSGYLHLPKQSIDLAEVTSIWYRRPYPSSPSPQITEPVAMEFIATESRETLDGLWRLLPVFWVSHPDKLRVAESKMYQLQVASREGFRIPDTLITNKPKEAQTFYQEHAENVVYKSLRYSRLYRDNEVSLIYTNVVEPSHVQQLESVKWSPVLLQPYVSKMVEIRATVVGKRVFAVELHSQQIPGAEHDWRRVDATDLPHELHELPPDIERKCIALVQAFGLQFSAIDLILTPEKEYVFIELNPNGQWAWIQQLRPEITIREALIDLLTTGGG